MLTRAETDAAASFRRGGKNQAPAAELLELPLIILYVVPDDPTLVSRCRLLQTQTNTQTRYLVFKKSPLSLIMPRTFSLSPSISSTARSC